MSGPHYEWAYGLLTRTLVHAREAGHTVRLVSGGAAWADHLAVTAFLRGAVSALTVHLPVSFEGGVVGGWSRDAATWARLHRQFSETIGRDTLAELETACERGATFTGDTGFKVRNVKVARARDALIAFTLGPYTRLWWPADAGFHGAQAAGIPTGGTAHTWGLARSQQWKLHQSMREFWG